MIPIWIFLRKIGKTIKKGVVGSSLSTITVIIYGTLSEYYLENSIPSSGIHSLFTSLWWTMQTLTTVGYGDTAVIGYLGRLNAMLIMVVGIGSLGYLLASVSANIVNSKISQRIGRVRLRLREHVIICNFDSTGKDIISELNRKSVPVVVVARSEIKEEGIEFRYVKGSCLEEESLKNAGISKSDTVIILSGRSASDEEYSEVDARTILMGMTVRKSNPDTYVVAEILDSANEVHAVNVGIDEIIVKGKLSSQLISNSIDHPGLSKILKDLIYGKGDTELKEIDLKKYSGKPFSLVYNEYEVPGTFILGFRKGGRVVSTISPDSSVENHSIIILKRRS
ncbi:hypothetical protein IX51_07555 [uncultured archaeon]|nr:hypothetical protein IX51_07555 [uncultured archaeon]